MGRPRADDRRTREGILYVLRTGCRWQDLPREYGAAVTVWRRLRAWEAAGVWELGVAGGAVVAGRTRQTQVGAGVSGRIVCPRKNTRY